jgi:hypothetical protein
VITLTGVSIGIYAFLRSGLRETEPAAQPTPGPIEPAAAPAP